MSQEFKFTDPGEGLQEGEILEVHVAEGDHVEDGDTVLTVETDKASTDVPAPFSGTIEKMHVKEGDTVEIGDVLITYQEDGAGEEGGGQEEEETEEGEERGQKEEEGKAQEEREEDREDVNKVPGEEEEQPAKQKGKKEAASSEEEEDQAGGEEEPPERGARERRRPSGESGGKPSREGPVPAAPSTRRLAREKGVDLASVQPSGPQGRVTAEDVEAAASGSGRQGGREQAGTSALTPSVAPGPMPDYSRWGEVERVPLRSIRRTTAQLMARSWSQIPHVYHQDVADVTELEQFRHEYQASAQSKGGKFTLMVLLMKALVFALKEFPRFNASLDVDNEEIVLKHYFHIGMAVATEQGLVAPVIRDVDRKNLTELTEEVTAMAEKTRGGEVDLEDMQGATMTITNPGAMGGTAFTPLINHPQVAILGMAQTRLQPAVRGDLQDYRIVPRLHLPLSLGFDHRVNDGAEAARFLTLLIEILGDPKSLLLKI